MIGQLLDGRYRIVRVLPSGGFGQTYLAEDIKRPGNPQCVVKQLQPLNNDPKILQISRRLFQTEAETLERLGHHDKIPQLFAFFEENQQFYLVQEFINGQTLGKILLGHIHQEDEILNLLTEILEILVFVHGQKVIHRDIKPENLIRRQSDNKIVLIDFGAVKQVATQTVNPAGQINATVAIGTPGYMPIEQFHGNPQFNSDIYALGVICIQALTGLLAHELSQLRDPNNPNTGEIVWSHRVPHISPKLIDILNKMVRFDYRHRYQSATEILNDLTKKSNKPQPKPALKLIGAITLIVVSTISLIFYVQKLINQPKTSDTQVLKTVKDKVNKGDYQQSPPQVLPQIKSINQDNQKLPLNGQIVNSNFGVYSLLLPNNSYYKPYIFDGRANQQVSIEMTSQEIDPSLILLDADGKEIMRNEDISASNFNAKIVTTLPKDGAYIVLAISSQTKQSGAYSLKAQVSNSR